MFESLHKKFKFISDKLKQDEDQDNWHIEQGTPGVFSTFALQDFFKMDKTDYVGSLLEG